MADIEKPTTDITIFDKTGDNSVDPILDGGIYRLPTEGNDNLKSWLGSTAPTIGQKPSSQSIPVVIASDQIPNSNSAPDLWQYYALYGQNFAFVTTFITISGQLETDFVLFRNPSGSGKIIRLHDIDYIYNKGAGIGIVRIYLNPTITSDGTPLNINNKYINYPNSPIAQAYLSPITTAKGTIRKTFGQSAVGTYSEEQHLGLIMPANSTLLLTVQPAANNTDHSMYMDWSEV